MYNSQLINEEQLVQVVGGLDAGGYRYEGHVGKYDGELGDKYYFIKDSDHNVVRYGVLIESYEDTYHVFWSKRMHIFRDVNTNEYVTVCGDDWTMYKTRIKI